MLYMLHNCYTIICKQVTRFKVKQFIQAEGTLVHIIRAYTALHLGGNPSQKTGTSPLAVNSSTTVYI